MICKTAWFQKQVELKNPLKTTRPPTGIHTANSIIKESLETKVIKWKNIIEYAFPVLWSIQFNSFKKMMEAFQLKYNSKQTFEKVIVKVFCWWPLIQNNVLTIKGRFKSLKLTIKDHDNAYIFSMRLSHKLLSFFLTKVISLT